MLTHNMKQEQHSKQLEQMLLKHYKRITFKLRIPAKSWGRLQIGLKNE
jgi:hypothetical protein